MEDKRLDAREQALQTLRRDNRQVRVAPPQQRHRRRWLAAVATVLIAGVAIIWWWSSRSAVVMVETVTVPTSVMSSVGTPLSASGYVIARQQSTISSKLTGMVERVVVSEGDYVKKGQLVAILDDSLERPQLAQAQAQLAVDKARVDESQAALDQARLTFQRQSKLAAEKLTSEASLDQARTDLKSDQAALSAAKAQVQLDEAAVQSAQTTLSYTRIYSPFSGVVTQVYAHPGEMISPAAVGGFTKTGICDVVDMASLEVGVDLNENYLAQVQTGMPADVILSTYPGKHIKAHVLEVVPVVNEAQATVRVRIGFDHLDPSILPGMQAQVFFQSTAAADHGAISVSSLVWIPDVAVHRDVSGAFVYVVKNGRIYKKSIRSGISTNIKVAVLAGLTGGEQIVVSANGKLHSGMSVQVQQ